jgi:hypothetical protein
VILELFGSPNVPTKSLYPPVKTDIHRAEYGCAVLHSARDESRPEAVTTEADRANKLRFGSTSE